MSSLTSLAALAADVAEDQWGLVTRAQALDHGVPRATFGRLVGSGVLVRVAHGVYRILGSVDPEHLDLRACWLQLDPPSTGWQRLNNESAAVISHRSAAAVYGLGDLIADMHEFTVPTRTQTRRPDVRLHRGLVPATDRAIQDGLPVTRPHRIVADLLAISEDESAVAAIALEAVGAALTTRADLARALAPLARRYRVNDGGSLTDRLLVEE